MRMDSVSAVDFSDLPEKEYDVAIFASGFEARSVYLHSRFFGVKATSVLVLGFSQDRATLSRESNDAYFMKETGRPPTIFPTSQSDLCIYEFLNRLLEGGVRPVHILVDYSVMTRAWYGAVLNWARSVESLLSIEIDFAYSHGVYASKFGPLSIEDVVSIPGFEGISSGARNTCAFFGLGFDKYATLAVVDRIEPDEVHCLIATSDVGEDQSGFVLKENAELVALAEGKVVALPITNVAEAFRLICEHISIVENEAEIVIVPMGPKPHVLASLLASQRLSQIACLHVKGSRSSPVEVTATGDITCCQVRFKIEPVSKGFS